jgi:alpha-L-fucosidase
MERNSASIYGASASPFLDLPWGRCTVNGNRLYLHVFDWPSGGELRLPGLRSSPRRAWLLDDPRRKLSVRSVGSDVLVGLSGKATDPMDTVLALELAAPPKVDPPVVSADTSSGYRLDYITAVTAGTTRKRFNRGGKFHISKWESPDDNASWHIRVDRAGPYRIGIRYAARPEWTGGRYVISIGSRSLSGTVEGSSGWYEYKDHDAGLVTLSEGGIIKVTLRPERPLGHDMLYLHSLSLVPAPVR